MNRVPRDPHIFKARIWHKRFGSVENAFNYRSLYLLTSEENRSKITAPRPLFGVNRFALWREDDRDHGFRDGAPPHVYLTAVLEKAGMGGIIDVPHIATLAMPRVAGYVFNPATFRFCPDEEGRLRAVICEVHNTFGEAHTYICKRRDNGVIARDDEMTADKIFHVSPFYDRLGGYRFRFAIDDGSAGMFIDYHGPGGEKRLGASLTGDFLPFTGKNIAKAFCVCPHPALKTTALIHVQALRLWAGKRVPYIPKPPQKKAGLSPAEEE